MAFFSWFFCQFLWWLLPFCNNDTGACDGQSTLTKINELQFVKDHNSYRLADPPDIGKRLDVTTLIELDLWSNANGWSVHHDFWEAGFSPPVFSDYLQRVKEWHDRNPTHEVIWINVDFKVDWLVGANQGDFENLIRKYFSNDVLYRPKDLKGSYDNVRDAAMAGNWPTADSLRGRVIVVITGGADFRHNQHQSTYVKSEIIGNNYEGAAFVAPDADDLDDTECSGDLDAINLEKKHVVMFNVKWVNRDRVSTSSIYDQKLLLWFWDVPGDESRFASAVEIYKASVIGLDTNPEDIISLNPDFCKVGLRGRPMET